MTRDEEVALVARIAAELYTRLKDCSGLTVEGSTVVALEIVEHAQSAVDSKRGCERDWERLETAARKVAEFDKGGGYFILSTVDTDAACALLDELHVALAACQPKEPKP